MKIKIKKARIAFANIHTPKSFDGETEPTFNATFLMAPDNPTIGEIHAAFEVVAKEKWGAKWAAVKKELDSKDRFCMHDGDLKAEFDGFPGNIYLSASNKSRPGIFDRDGKTQLVAADGKPYSGCYVNASVDLWAMDNKYGKRICASLLGVQFHSHGQAFSGSNASDENEFDSVDDEEFDLV